jgi:hypothetical protein
MLMAEGICFSEIFVFCCAVAIGEKKEKEKRDAKV